MHLIQTVNGKTRELYLCEQCAKQSQEMNPVFHPAMGVAGLLQALWGFNPAVNEVQKEENCPVCGVSFTQITRAGKLGCSRCYEKFEAQLAPVLRRLHGGGQHKGKIPQRRGAVIRDKMEIKELKERLQALIRQENFEEAAGVRDQIKGLEQTLGVGGDANAKE
jgi:protein arginine kinase activator